MRRQKIGDRETNALVREALLRPKILREKARLDWLLWKVQDWYGRVLNRRDIDYAIRVSRWGRGKSK
mgnify:CR=1 FL=1